MKRIGLFLLAVFVMTGMACSGSEDYMDDCASYYCGLLCDEAVACGLFTPLDVDNQCMPICTTMAVAKSDMECQDIYSPATRMSCDELATFFDIQR